MYKMSKRILVINPNSSESITAGIASQITIPIPNIAFTYLSGPSDSPPEINNSEDGLISTEACLRLINSDKDYYLSFDGYLVCCFSDHPLIYGLREIIKAPVMGIFQASLLYSLNTASDTCKVAILTSSKDWEQILDDSLLNFFNGPSDNDNNDKYRSLPSYFLPTLASNVDVLRLADPANYATIKSKVYQLIQDNARIVILGCAGLSTLDSKLKLDFPGIKFVDSIKVGAEMLATNIRIEHYISRNS